MAFERAPGYPDYTYSGDFKNIPIVYSNKYQVKFYYTSPIPMMTNSDFNADVNKPGEKVVIFTRPTIVVKKYSIGGTMEMDTPTSPSIEFPMNRQNYFYFGLDKTVKARMLNSGKFMDECNQDAGEQVNTAIASEFLDDIVDFADSDNIGNTAGFGQNDIKLGTTGSFPTITSANVLKYIAACEVVGDLQNWPDEGRYITLPSVFKACVQLSNLGDSSYAGLNQPSPIIHGKIAKVGKMNVLISNQIKKTTDTGKVCHHIPFGQMSGIGFASKVIESVYFDKFEKFSGEGVRVVNLYDWKVVAPKSLGVLYAAIDLGLE